jgi:hypothetical protein
VQRENPFRVGGPVRGEQFTDRAEEVARVRRALREPSSLLVYGARRMGKSSVIRMAVDGERRGAGRTALVAWADFSTATTLADVANRVLRSLASELAGGVDGLLAVVRGIRPEVTLRFDSAGLPVLSLAPRVRREPVEDQRLTLESVLDQVEELGRERSAAGEGPVALVFDEFQDILEIGGERADWYLRGIMQRHGHVSYVCAGSRESLIHEMLDRKRAFYKHFELLHLGPLDSDHLARWIEDRMAGAGVDAASQGAAILRVAGERTQDRLQVAREVYAAARGRGRVEPADLEHAVDVVVRAGAAVFAALWSSLSPVQQNTLRAVASAPEQLYGADVLHRFGLNSSAALAGALRVLVDRGICVRDDSPAGASVDNPFFRVWLEREVLPDVPG